MTRTGYTFDMLGAYQSGATRHPQVEIRAHFPDASDFEANSITDSWSFNAEERDGLPDYFEKLGGPFVTAGEHYRAKMSAEAFTRQLSARAAPMLDRLLAAFARQHDRMGLTSRTDERGRCCQYPVGEPWGDTTERHRENTRALADEYFAKTEIPPAECMVVMWLEGMSGRVEYERRPEGWR